MVRAWGLLQRRRLLRPRFRSSQPRDESLERVDLNRFRKVVVEARCPRPLLVFVPTVAGERHEQRALAARQPPGPPRHPQSLHARKPPIHPHPIRPPPLHGFPAPPTTLSTPHLF